MRRLAGRGCAQRVAWLSVREEALARVGVLGWWWRVALARAGSAAGGGGAAPAGVDRLQRKGDELAGWVALRTLPAGDRHHVDAEVLGELRLGEVARLA